MGGGDIRESFLNELAPVKTIGDLEQLRVRYLGKKGILTAELKKLGGLPPEERRSAGALLNETKIFVEAELAARKEELKELDLREKFASQAIDVTLPGKYTPPGRTHPIIRVMREATSIFVAMGFSVEEGPEVELDYYNFEALNIPKEHPAREMQDTFYVSPDIVLRTHTSPVQVRVMQRKKPPVKFIAPGKVYRCDADISHTPMFHQIEGFMVADDISFSHLKAVLESFLHRIFSPDVPVRFRPSYFPFTEPSAEVDIGCIFCKGTGCRTCKGTGWIEILGAGMVHPHVLQMVGYDARIYSGFAFGIGMERIAMLKYSIDDIRLFFENDLRFLGQF
ncbi:MAG: phenylalanine--tRNA ligase subunit alpha [Nitrospiraceae bacterium]|nr:phenylalanine--tRNA ligase subunit alpha [Nitrospiraceae bacterium]MDA8326472.1 phenylalanine--tRNA ligase subunit alpha [Nitrospiraceae bacterium]